MNLFGIERVGVNGENGRKLLRSPAFVAAVLLVNAALRALLGPVLARTDHATRQARFWTRQGVSLLAAIVLLLGLLSIWFNDPARLSTAFGPMSAGLALRPAAGHHVDRRPLRHPAARTFTVGDRISMGGVRGDVMRLGLIQATTMEMGQPPSVQDADPAMWIKSRQFTAGSSPSPTRRSSPSRSTTTREFEYLWEELTLPITCKADRRPAEQILLAAVRRRAVDPHSLAANAKNQLRDRLGIEPIDLEPRVYSRITDNWLGPTARFLVRRTASAGPRTS